MTILKNGPSSDRDLQSAAPAQPQSSARCPRPGSTAAGTDEPFRPTKFKQVLPAGRLGREAMFHFHERPRIILGHNLGYYMLGLVESSKYPLFQIG